MPTPAKDRFMLYILQTFDALEFNCLLLSKDVPKFNSAYLTHSMSIITGMVQRIRRHLLVNRIELKQRLPKGVLKHGTKRLKKGKFIKAPKR